MRVDPSWSAQCPDCPANPNDMSLRGLHVFPCPAGISISKRFQLANASAEQAISQLRALQSVDGDGGTDLPGSAGGHLLCTASGGKMRYSAQYIKRCACPACRIANEWFGVVCSALLSIARVTFNVMLACSQLLLPFFPQG